MDGQCSSRSRELQSTREGGTGSWRHCPLQLKVQMNVCLWLVACMGVVFPPAIALQKPLVWDFSHSFLLCILTTQIPWCCPSAATWASFPLLPLPVPEIHEPRAFVEPWCPLGIQSCPCISAPSWTRVSTCALSAFCSVSVAGTVNAEEGQSYSEEVYLLWFFYFV